MCSFNTDCSCIILINESTFYVYNVLDFSLRFSKTMEEPLLIVEMLYTTNIFAIVYKNSPKCLVIWDDFKSAVVSSINFSENVNTIKLKRDIIVISTTDYVYLYNLELNCIGKHNFINSIVSLNSSTDPYVLAISNNNEVKLLTTKNDRNIKVCNNPIGYLSLSISGKLLATTSIKGTIIRVYNTETGHLVKEFRRSTTQANINCIIFDSTEKFIAISSDKGTIHIFSIYDTTYTSYLTEQRSIIAFSLDGHKKPLLMTFKNTNPNGDILPLIIVSEDHLLTSINISKSKYKILTYTSVTV